MTTSAIYDRAYFDRMREGDTLRAGGRPSLYDEFLSVVSHLPLQNMRIQFEETIDITTSPIADLPVNWTAAWTPPALRATLRIKDEKSLELRTVSRIFKILAN